MVPQLGMSKEKVRDPDSYYRELRKRKKRREKRETGVQRLVVRNSPMRTHGTMRSVAKAGTIEEPSGLWSVVEDS